MSPFSYAHLILFFGADVLLSKNVSRSIRDQVRERKLAAWHHQKRSLYFAPT
jgi:hypothetical protein